MKTINQLFRKKTWLIYGVMIMFVSFISGCQKDEMPQMNNSSETENSSMERNSQQLENTISYEMLSINHNKMFSTLPDYKVTLQSNGSVIFEGRKNTAFIGITKLMVPIETANEIRDLYLSLHLGKSADQPVNIDLPINTTTFKANFGKMAVSRNDYNSSRDPEMQKLIQARIETEKMLGIERLVYTQRNINDLKDNPASEK
jgi:hypothetical protein